MAAASIISSVVTGGSNNHSTVSSEANAYATDFVSQGILGSFTNTSGVAPMTGSFGVQQDTSPDMGVTILGTGNTTNGEAIAYVSGVPTSQDTQVLRARMTSNYTGYTINANTSGSTKYDWIYLQLSATNAATPSSAADNVITLYTSRSSSNTTDNGSPPTYGIILAVVTVANNASSIVNANIADKRSQTTLNIGSTSNTNGWQTLNYPLTYASNAGNREFTVTTPNNLTGILSPGMKLRVSRSVTPPTQCASFVSASSQYATNSSPSGISFTAAFTCEAWIYLNSYTAGGIISRSDGTTGGFQLQVNASGQLTVTYGASSAFTQFTSYQSIPLNQWTHVAGVITSVSSKTGALYINGVLTTGTASLSAATTLTQTGNLTVGGASSTGTNPFNGYISEARVWSVANSQATIQQYMTINCVGNESNLVSLYQLNGAWTDATSNANTLTANGGASNTQTSNPYNATEYAVINTISYSNPTTTITLDTGTQCTIPNQTLNNPYYSVAENPFGITAGLENNRTLANIILMTDFNTTSTSYVDLSGATAAVTIPSGRSAKVVGFIGHGSASISNAGLALNIFDVTAGVQLSQIDAATDASGDTAGLTVFAFPTPPSGSRTYKLQFKNNGNAATVHTNGSITMPVYFRIELVS